jgi:hypothetical protein
MRQYKSVNLSIQNVQNGLANTVREQTSKSGLLGPLDTSIMTINESEEDEDYDS